MFVYQALIMGAILLIIFLLLFVFRVRNRAALVGLMVLLAVGGAAALGAVQNMFNTKLYPQPINVALLRDMQFSDSQRADIGRLFPDYSSVAAETEASGDTIRAASGSVAGNMMALMRSYTITAKGATSHIRVMIYSFSTKAEASQYFEIRQRFYNTKNYLPADSTKSQKSDDSDHKYVTSYIKSMYPDYTDFLFVPSKITCYSEVQVQDKNIIVDVYEESNKAVANKTSVIEDIIRRIEKN